MKGPTHILGGLVTAAGMLSYSTPNLQSIDGVALTAATISLSIFGSLLPDIDHNNSTISHKCGILSFLYRGIASIGKFLKIKCFEHRGVMHTLIIPLIILLLTFGIQNTFWQYLGYALLFGYLSHLFLDALNPTGVPLLSPFFNIKVRFLPKKLCIHTGSFSELFVQIALILLLVFVSKPFVSIFFSLIGIK